MPMKIQIPFTAENETKTKMDIHFSAKNENESHLIVFFSYIESPSYGKSTMNKVHVQSKIK